MMRMPHENQGIRRSQSAFTLIEVVIAVLMMGIVAAACFASLGVAYRAQRAANELLEPSRGSKIAMKRLGQDIGSMLPPRGTLAGPLRGDRATSQAGERADVLEFHALTREGIRRIAWTIERSDERLEDRRYRDSERAWNLVRRVWDNLLAPIEADPATQVIARGVRGIEVEYFDGTDWMAQWDSTLTDNQLPQAIRVTLSLQIPESVEADLEEEERQDYLVSGTFTLPCAEPPAGGRVSR